MRHENRSRRSLDGSRPDSGRALTLQHDKVLFLLQPNEITRPLARKCVMVIDYPDGRLSIQYERRDLPYEIFDKLQKVDQAAIVENKRLGEVLAYVAERPQIIPLLDHLVGEPE